MRTMARPGMLHWTQSSMSIQSVGLGAGAHHAAGEHRALGFRV